MASTASAGSQSGTRGAVAPPDPWDPVVRITHWSIAVAVLANEFLVKPGGTAHVWIGWGVMAVLALRLLWGLVGPREARFSAFPPDPRGVLSHLADLVRGRATEHPSHNPAGAAMAYALWVSLGLMIATGLVMTDGKTPVRIAQDRAAVADGDWSVLLQEDAAPGDKAAGTTGAEDAEGAAGIAEEVHVLVSNLILVLALLHVAGVVLESRALGRNILRPMIGGRGT